MWPADGTPTGTITVGQRGAGSNSNERVLHIPQTPGLEPPNQMQFSIIFNTLVLFDPYMRT